MKTLHVTKKTNFMLERKHKGLKEAFSFALMNFGIVLILCTMGFSLSAQTTTGLSVGITNSMNAADIENNIQNAIAGVTPGETVTITGLKNNENAKVNLNIPADITVIWEAVSKGLSFNINNGGTFEVAEGTIDVNGKNAINVDAGHVIISGGNVVTNRTYADYGEWRSAIYVKYGTVTITGGKVSAFSNAAAVQIDDGDLRMSGGELSVTDVDVSQFGYALGFCYTIRISNYATVAITGGKVIAEGSIEGGNYCAISFDACGLAAYLAGTCIGNFDMYLYPAYGIIVEVESLDIPVGYHGTNNGLTQKAGGNINEAWWDTSEETPYIHFEHNSWYDFSVPWKGAAPINPPAEYPVRLRETGELFNTLSEAIDTAKIQNYNTFTLEVIDDVTETSDVIIGSEDVTIVGVNGKHTFAFTDATPSSNFKFSVNGGGKLTLGDGTNKNTLTILHSVSVTNGTIDVRDGVILESDGNVVLLMSGSNVNGTISGGRFEATGSNAVALSLEKGAILSEISGGTFIGKKYTAQLSNTGTRIELISGGAFYQKGAYAEPGMFPGHALFVQNGSTIGEITGGYFEADPEANCALFVTGGAWVDKISGGDFVAIRPGKTREPGEDQWNSVIYILNGSSESSSVTGIGMISGGHFHGGAHFGMLLLTSGSSIAQVNAITGGLFEGIVGVQNDVGGRIRTISGGKIYGGQGMLNIGIIDNITGDADIRGSSSYGIFNYYTNSSFYGRIIEISGGKISSTGTSNAHALQNSGVVDSITGGTFTSFSSGYNSGIRNSSSYGGTPRIGKITGGTIMATGFGNGVSNASTGIINEISGGTISGGIGYVGSPYLPIDIYGSGIYNEGTINRILDVTVIGYNNAINCDGAGRIDTIFNGVFWGQTKPAINLVKTLVLEPELNATIGFGRYWGKDGVIFNNDDLVDFPGDYVMSTETKAVESIQEVEFKYLRLRKITLDLKLFLQGPTNNGNYTFKGEAKNGTYMTNYIQVPRLPWFTELQLPIDNPYGIPGSYPEINNVKGPAYEIVDWILVEIWGNFNESTYTYDLLEARALLLQVDGSVVDVDGNLPEFDVQQGDVRIVVKHRNHLAVMSSERLAFNSGTIEYDFSTGINKAYTLPLPTLPAQMIMKNNVAALIAGDLNMDYTINATDVNIFNNTFYFVSGVWK
ncbi:MAG: hypothetical protein FWC34_03340, partial [Bacteroidetes bacterium]|nr:hypothetical protein [Bacteroidota bacterium]MCL2303484.1 hypothetical protein [Lentimicrobiaceae bacterium]